MAIGVIGPKLTWRARVLGKEKLFEFRTKFRSLMPVCRRFAYFDHAAVAPLPSPAGQAISDWLAQAMNEGDVPWLQWAENLRRCRDLGAQLLQATPEEIALVPNTTLGIHYVAAGIPWKTGDQMIAVGNEFPSNLLPWKQLASAGVDVAIYQPSADGTIEVEKILALVTPQTRLVAVSWVGFATGFRLALWELSQALQNLGILLMLDSIQGLGIYSLDVREIPVDFVVADGHKWLLGPEGAGLLFIRQKHLEWLRPVGVGWNSVQGSFSFAAIEMNWKDSAARYEGGSHNMAGFAGLAASLQAMQQARDQFGPSIWEDAVLDVADYAAQRLVDRGATLTRPQSRDNRSGIISFSWHGKDPQHIRQRCLEAGIVLSCRLGKLRISTHGYNNSDDIDRLLDTLCDHN